MIRRYTVGYDGRSAEMERYETDYGEYVLYKDHKAEVDKLKVKIRELEALVDTLHQ